MAEPEEILLDGAHHATRFVQRLWRHHVRHNQPQVLYLADCRARLELFMRAAFGVSLTVGAADAPEVPSWLRRWALRLPRHLIVHAPLAETDGIRVRLPASIASQSEPGGGWAVYRLWAAQMAARVLHETPRWLPAEPLARDLYLLREAERVDQLLSTELPGLALEINAARRAALAERPAASVLTPLEAVVEDHIAAVLKAPVQARKVECSTAHASLHWALEHAEHLRAAGSAYRGVAPVALWGNVRPLGSPPKSLVGAPGTAYDPGERPRVGKMRRSPVVRQAAEDEDDQNMGMLMIQLDEPQEHVEDPMGLSRPTDRDAQADPEGLADSLAELPEARLVTSPERPKEILVSNDPPPKSAEATQGAARPGGFIYPEWDYRTSTYQEQGAVVREQPPRLGDLKWAEGVFTRRALLLADVRRRFERLRARRTRVGRQLDGPDFDLQAYVASEADRRAGLPADDRLYVASRSARRDVAIAVLVDVSGSTDSWTTENLRIVDVEKEALLVVATALEALGDPFAIVSFSGETRSDVCVAILKSFAEPTGPTLHRRIAGLEPDRFTRLGAALRHTTSMLVQKPARHRLLLVLSDGKPNDVDIYEGRYGIEDTRQAVAEAQLQGIHPFCLTVDRQAPSYMPRMFGAGKYAVLPHPVQLPSALVQVLRGLVQT